ncbi:MAG: mannose-1-phosphate guanylyltransferase [Candidatus Omnitrophica bacterium]|nr:mannose-1-phosphate guanylyltransferase [Candidatus Omnitrophota bacterium]
MGATENNLVAAIMAGGAGTRFWPLSTEEKPKQFIKIFDDRSLLQKSYDRVSGIIPDDRILVLTSNRFVHLVREQLPMLPAQNVIGEPERKDTAAAVALGAVVAKKLFGNPVMSILTADHLIEPIEVFQKTLLSAAAAARESGALYTFGIKPTYPASAYGYLETGEPTLNDDGIEHFRLGSFKEKPDAKTAEHYLGTGRYLWNSGMFVWTVDSILGELERNVPNHVQQLSSAVESLGGAAWEEALAKSFSALQKISIDFAVMEHAQDIRCVAGEFSWRDVGGWLAMTDFLSEDSSGNHTQGDLHALDSSGNLIYCEDPTETIALLGLSDIVVVRAGGKTLVARKDRLEDVKKIVEGMGS